MAPNTQTAGGQEPRPLAAVDYDGGEWYVATGNRDRFETRTLSDASQLAELVGGASSVVATDECRDNFAGAAPTVKPHLVPRLLSIAQAFRRELNGQPCLILWMGTGHTVCGLVEKGTVREEKTDDSGLTLSHIFEHYVEIIPALRAWMATREPQQKQQAFATFLANLRSGATAPVGPSRWMRPETRLPQQIVEEGWRDLRGAVDPRERATRLVLSGWAAAAHWDLPRVLTTGSPAVSLLKGPDVTGFHHSVAGLMELAPLNQAPHEPAPVAVPLPPLRAGKAKAPEPEATALETEAPAAPQSAGAAPAKEIPAAKVPPPPRATVPQAPASAAVPAKVPAKEIPAAKVPPPPRATVPQAPASAAAPAKVPAKEIPAAKAPPPPQATIPQAPASAAAPAKVPAKEIPAARVPPPPRATVPQAPASDAAAPAKVPAKEIPAAKVPLPASEAAAPTTSQTVSANSQAIESLPLDLREQVRLAQERPIVGIAKAGAALARRMGPSDAAESEAVLAHLRLAQQSEEIDRLTAAQDSKRLREELPPFQAAVASLERNYKPDDLLSLLDRHPGGDLPEKQILLQQTGLEPEFPVPGTTMLSTSHLDVADRKGAGQFAHIVKVHRPGYKLKGRDEYLRRPQVDVALSGGTQEFARVPPPRRKWLPWIGLAAGALVALVIGFKMYRTAQEGNGFQLVREVDTTDPIREVWSTLGGQYLAAMTQVGSDEPCKLRIWHGPDWSSAAVLQAPCTAAAISPDGQLAAWSSDDFLPTITKISDNLPLRTMGPENFRHQSQISALAFSPDGKMLYSASLDGYVRKWDVDKGTHVADLDMSEHRALQSLLAPTNELVAAGEASTNASVNVWVPNHPSPIKLTGASDAVVALAYDARTDTLVGGGAAGETLLWLMNLAAKAPITPFATKPSRAPERVHGLAMAPDGRIFVAFSHSVFLWRLQNGDVRGGDSFTPSGTVSGLALVRDGNATLLATAGGQDHSVKLWRLPSGN